MLIGGANDWQLLCANIECLLFVMSLPGLGVVTVVLSGVHVSIGFTTMALGVDGLPTLNLTLEKRIFKRSFVLARRGSEF